MVYYIRNFVFIYVIIVIIPSDTYAPWTIKPQALLNDKHGQCYDWLFHHEFTSNNVDNRKLASIRVKEYDQDVSYFAAAFAYLLSNSSELYDINYFGPSEFCELHTVKDATYPYITLKDAEFTCEGWIDLYIYDKNRNYSKDRNYNIVTWVINRDFSMDNKISLWAALYFKYITSELSNVLITSREFCILMNKPVMNVQLPKKFPFMTIDGSKMSCKEWKNMRGLPILEENVFAGENSMNVTKLPFTNIAAICYEQITQCGFSDDNSNNYQMILSESVDVKSVNPFAKYYIYYVKERHRFSNEFKRQLELQYQILQLLNIQNDRVDETYQQIQNHPNVVDTLMAPKQFCEVRNVPDRELINYLRNT